MLELPPAYAREWIRYLRSPQIFVKEVDLAAPEAAKLSAKYLGFAFLLTSAIVLVELRLLPEELTGPVAKAIQKDQLIFSYWLSTLVFVLLAHVASKSLSGQGLLRTTLAGLFRVYSFLIPATTLTLIALSLIQGLVIGNAWFVTPPLGVLLLEPLDPSTAHLLFFAAFFTVYFYLALFFFLCTLWTLHEIHRFSYVRTLVAASSSLLVLLLCQPLIVFCVRKVFDPLEPLIKLLL